MSEEKPKLLLVEDNQITRTSLRTMFDRAGYEVVEADSLDSAAAQLLKIGSLHALVTDYELESGTGLDVLKIVVRAFPECKLGVFTAFDEIESDEKMLSFLNNENLKGRVAFFYKPIESSAFIQWLRN